MQIKWRRKIGRRRITFVWYFQFDVFASFDLDNLWYLARIDSGQFFAFIKKNHNIEINILYKVICSREDYLHSLTVTLHLSERPST